MTDTDPAALLRMAAAGRREYASRLPVDDPRIAGMREELEAEAVTLDAAARVVDGDLGPLYGWLPSWRWTDEMDAQLLGREP